MKILPIIDIMCTLEELDIYPEHVNPVLAPWEETNPRPESDFWEPNEASVYYQYPVFIDSNGNFCCKIEGFSPVIVSRIRSSSENEFSRKLFIELSLYEFIGCKIIPPSVAD